jgi:hypothetical protein
MDTRELIDAKRVRATDEMIIATKTISSTYPPREFDLVGNAFDLGGITAPPDLG